MNPFWNLDAKSIPKVKNLGYIVKNLRTCGKWLTEMKRESLTNKLINIAINLSSENELTRLLEKIVFELRSFFRADGGTIFLKNGEFLHFKIAQNDTLRKLKGQDYQLFEPFKLPINEYSIAGYVALTGSALNIPDVYQIPPDLPYKFDPSFDRRNDYKTRSLLAIPLKNRNQEVIGVLELINAQDQRGRIIPFPKAWEDLVLALGSQAAVAITNAQLLESLEKLRAAEKKRFEYYLEAIFQSVKDAIITLDQNLQIVAVNEAAFGLCGFDPRTVVGQNFFQVAKDCSGACLELLKGLNHNGDRTVEVYQECHREGRPHQMVSLTRTPLKDHAGERIGTLLVVRDLSPRFPPADQLSDYFRSFGLIGKSPAMQEVFRALRDLLPADITVLITGKTGTGKELVAEVLHYGGPRRNKPLVKVNCSALAENLLESELFGHVKGAFTGAHRDAPGRLQAAEGGTLFLDEVGDLSPKIQVKLLRVLEDKSYERVGESLTRKADIRIIAATNRDLKSLVRQGRFREDLYYRLKVFEIHLPSLRERLEDLPLLVEHFRLLFNQKYRKQVQGLLPPVWEIFRNYPWPGNVRELKHVLEHAFVQCKGSLIQPEDLPKDLLEGRLPPQKRRLGLREVEEALAQTGGNKAKAARILGISRPTLYRLLRGPGKEDPA